MPSLDSDPIDISVMREVMPEEHQAAFDVIAALYGHNTENVIHGLMDMTVRAAILGGVSNVSFAQGVKAHWDEYADHMNRAAN